MHEMSFAVALVEEVGKLAAEKGLKYIDEVEVEAGVLKAIVPEILSDAFKMAGEGTIMENALLKITEVKARAMCNLCGGHFEPAMNDFLCRTCRKADVKVISGEEFLIRSISGKG